MKKGISVNYNTLLQIAIFGLAFTQIGSYINAPWEITRSEWSIFVYATQMSKSSTILMLCKNISFFLIILLTFAKIKMPRKSAVYLVLYLPICLVHSALLIAEQGLTQSLYVSNIAWMYLLLFGFWLGQDQELWEKISSCVPMLLIIYVAAFGISFYSSFSKYGWLVYQNSSLMTFYSQIVWLSVITLHRHISKEKVTLWDYILCGVLVVYAIIIRSRSWVIVSVAIGMFTIAGILRSKGKSLSRFIKISCIAALILTFTALFLTKYLGDFVTSLVKKGTFDSRSFQYLEMFEQTSWYSWIIGNGTNATYVSKLYGDYTFIDNEFVYMSFHYGVIFAVLYFLPYIKTIVFSFRKRRYLRNSFLCILYLLIWVLSVNGLSVFNRILIDPKSALMPMFAGYLFSLCSTSEADYENNVCC